jgi:regulatory protein
VVRQALSLKGQALALLARREHSRQELRTKLLAHARKLAQQAQTQLAPGAAPAEAEAGALDACAATEAVQAQVEALLDDLQARHYLSDERFAEGRVNARAARMGQARIEQELARHGVSLPEELAEQLRATELSRAQQVWQRRFGTVASEMSERARQMRFLAARGFSAEVIRRVVGGRGLPDAADGYE